MDEILLQAFKGLGVGLPEDASTLGQLSADLVLESAARCVNAILQQRDGDGEGAGQGRRPAALDPRPPASMSARYNLGARLAELCLDLGYPARDDLGYQTFLYSNESELRQLFMFLVDKLPKEKEERMDVLLDRPTQVKSAIAREIRQQLSSSPASAAPPPSKCDPFCSCSVCLDTSLDPSLVNLLPKESRNAAFNLLSRLAREKEEGQNKLSCSLIQHNDERLAEERRLAAAAKEEAEVGKEEEAEPRASVASLVARLQQDVASSAGGDQDEEVPAYSTALAAAAPMPLPTSIREAGESEGPDSTTRTEKEKGADERTEEKERLALKMQDKMKDLLEEKAEAEKEAQESQAEYKEQRNELIKLRKSVKEYEAREQSLPNQIEERKKELANRSRLVELLPDGSENLTRLRAIVKKSENKMESLKEQWEEVKARMEREHEQLLEEQKLKKTTKNAEEEALETLLAKVQETERKLKERDAVCKKYSAAVEKLKGGESRSSYTRRILELLRSIKKQRNETDKVIEDIKQTQKDINLLDGKLYRTYADADAAIFQLCRGAPTLSPAYKHVTELHRLSTDTVESVRKTGRVRREIRELLDQAAAEKDKGAEEKCRRLEQDLDDVRRENREMRARLRAAAAAVASS